MNKYIRLRENLGIDAWLKLVKEDRNLNSAYISFAQYMYCLEKENANLKEALNEIREYVNSHKSIYEPDIDSKEILQIVDKVLERDK